MGKLIDLTGQQFGRLTVIEKSNKRSSSGHVYWKCKCSCGKECEVLGSALRSGHTKSCGCYSIEKTIERDHNRLEDLTGQKFNKLTVLYRSNNHIQSGGQVKTQWHCKCDCGNECDVLAYSLKTGRVKSCGCIKKSYGEELIAKILTDNNIPFEQEYSFTNCIFPDTNKYARFDFYINKKYLIEFDGKQHFESDAGWEESIEAIQKRDNFKNQWCKENNIPLYRIPYYDIKNLHNVEDLIQEKYKI